MVREVSTEAVQSKLDGDDDITVVDIRNPGDYEQGHVPGAINVPLPQLPQQVEAHDWDADEVVTVCPLGKSSVQAARLLGSYEGIDADAVASMDGGYREWDGELESEATAGDGGSSPGSEDRRSPDSDEGPEAPF